MIVGVFSESYAKAETYVDPATRKTVTKSEAELISGAYYTVPYFSLSLLAGVSPGSMQIDGKQTPFVVPNVSKKFYIYFDNSDTRRRVPPVEQLARNFLNVWSGTYANPVYPTRAFAEYKNIRSRIYVETEGADRFRIGHSTFTTAQVKAGRLDFLTSMSSANTEVVYLGQTTPDELLDFYEKNGFADAAKHLRSHSHPGAAELGAAKEFRSCLTGWDQLSADGKSDWLGRANGDANLARDEHDKSNNRLAVARYNNALLEDALKNGVAPSRDSLPTNLVYSDAWQAYVEDRMKANPTPPEWFITEFLEPLGFDKRVMVLEQ